MHLFLILILTLTAVAGDLPRLSVSREQWINSPCRPGKVTPDISQLISGNMRTQTKVGGIVIRNESEKLVSAFKQLAGNQDFSTAVPQDCDKVQCAVEAIWGSGLGLRILSIKLRHGFNASEFAFDDTSRFSPDELEDVAMALDSLPENLIPLGKRGNQRLVTAAVGSLYPVEGITAAADATIKLYDPWRKLYPTIPGYHHFTRQTLLYHELGHVVGSIGRPARHDSKSWKDLIAECAVSTYAQTNAKEDFAETFKSYRFAGEELRKTCPRKYEYMRTKVYEGREFLSENDCTPEN